MAEKSAVGLIQEWQTGALLIILSFIIGSISLIGLGSLLPTSPVVGLSVFLGGAVVAFVVLSYIIYGR